MPFFSVFALLLRCKQRDSWQLATTITTTKKKVGEMASDFLGRRKLLFFRLSNIREECEGAITESKERCEMDSTLQLCIYSRKEGIGEQCSRLVRVCLSLSHVIISFFFSFSFCSTLTERKSSSTRSDGEPSSRLFVKCRPMRRQASWSRAFYGYQSARYLSFHPSASAHCLLT